MPPPENKRGFRFYHDVLGNPKYVVAPMVDASELAWRMLARKYNAQLCYTYELFEFIIVLKNITYNYFLFNYRPMWHSAVFVRDEKYRCVC